MPVVFNRILMRDQPEIIAFLSGVEHQHLQTIAERACRFQAVSVTDCLNGGLLDGSSVSLAIATEKGR